MKKFISILCVFLLIFGFTSCNQKDSPSDNLPDDDTSATLSIVVTTLPIHDWIKNVLGSVQADIHILMDTGVDMHSFQPTAEDLVTLSTADLFICIGGDSDHWVEDALNSAKNDDLQTVKLLDVLGDSVLKTEHADHDEHEHEELDSHAHEDEHHDHEELDSHAHEDEHHDEEHHHHEFDEHVWLSLRNAVVFVNEFADVLGNISPENAEAFNKNASEYVAALEALDEEYKNMVADAKFDTLVFADRFPFAYFVSDYGLNHFAAFSGCSAESEASFETLVFLAEKVDELGLPYVCVMKGSDGELASTVYKNSSLGSGEPLVLDSMQSFSIGEDYEDGTTYLDTMRANIHVFAKALGSDDYV
ncbi:MAG TPA: zinc ABC transporter substrate-binding protein [Clostridiales bacterium]|nr:zinc ABC transporter substrate-binding protein [Clostridiales bacterium]